MCFLDYSPPPDRNELYLGFQCLPSPNGNIYKLGLIVSHPDPQQSFLKYHGYPTGTIQANSAAWRGNKSTRNKSPIIMTKSDIQQCYNTRTNFHCLFTDDQISQTAVMDLLRKHDLTLQNLDDLGNGWSKRWSTRGGSGPKNQCGSSTEAIKEKYNKKRKSQGLDESKKDSWCKAPYDFTGCLVHIDITYHVLDFSVQRITGILQHDETCLQQNMKRIPPIPLHEHVWKVALQQLSEGATITAIQYHNQELFQGELYNGQKSINQQTTNVCYEFLPSDSTRLFQKISKLCGINVSKPPQHNIDKWLNPTSPTYKPQVAAAVFYYKARIELNDCLCICIHTPEMQEAA
ncbi:hypothetical protein K439DRAFT_1625319 [Ramaria rubella]|nr:hypothetical protein K439DRAFT_1625319 [Ramaria rubella]